MTQTTWVKHDLKHDPGKEAECHLIWSGTLVGHHETENPLPWRRSGAWEAAPRKPEPEEAPPSASRAAAWNQHSHGAVGQGQMFGQHAVIFYHKSACPGAASSPAFTLCCAYYIELQATPSSQSFPAGQLNSNFCLNNYSQNLPLTKNIQHRAFVSHLSQS